MSIHHLFTRTRDGVASVCTDRVIDPAVALRYLITAEFGYGSKVVSVSPTEIRTTSSCMGSVDDMIFNGPEEDMRKLVRFTNLYTEALDSMIVSESRRVSTQDAVFNAHANAFIAQSSKGEGSLKVTLMTLISIQAPAVDFSKLNGGELLELFMQLEFGELSADEVNEVFA